MGKGWKKPFTIPGPRGLDVVRSAVEAGSFDDGNRQADRTASTKANAYGYLDRDKQAASIWYPTDRARAMLAWLESGVSGAQVPALTPEPIRGVASLEQDAAHAVALFDAGDIRAAELLASELYDRAKRGGRFSERFNLKASLESCHRIQATALSVEVKAKMRIAEEWEKAKAEGKTLKGRPKSVPDENAFSAEDVGLTRKELHYAKELLQADRREPGIAERAIAARLAQGLEPTRASLRSQIGTKTATKEERGDNLYETPPEAVHTLLALERFKLLILEPACGKGAISRPLEAAGFGVILSDLNDYGTADENGELQDVRDFLATERNGAEPDIITNPPYGELLNAFVAHALRVHKPRKMALLLNLNFLAGFDDPDRNFAMDENPPARIHVFKRRLPMMHRDGWDGPKASSSMNTAWFVWEMQNDGSYGKQTVIRRVDWKDYVPEVPTNDADAVAESEAA